ncbi:hypothetical protein TRFO_21439 [Tritrichomonas foetus]|uniref:Helicase ATP-binding domain-containing protein n=1 Tax=Tritrichomonas foetus TaxID=1144522 RepID=A0A1J4KJW3_9EUKA|nr:hypothetical protein TRFO_21439 [Tritrichomonas foetus]|eukprot:OHT09629.1 hypothetical protein TRFO_21439 [Tritrichomonas foetus]
MDSGKRVRRPVSYEYSVKKRRRKNVSFSEALYSSDESSSSDSDYKSYKKKNIKKPAKKSTINAYPSEESKKSNDKTSNEDQMIGQSLHKNDDLEEISQENKKVIQRGKPKMQTKITKLGNSAKDKTKTNVSQRKVEVEPIRISQRTSKISKRINEYSHNDDDDSINYSDNEYEKDNFELKAKYKKNDDMNNFEKSNDYLQRKNTRSTEKLLQEINVDSVNGNLNTDDFSYSNLSKELEFNDTRIKKIDTSALQEKKKKKNQYYIKSVGCRHKKKKYRKRGRPKKNHILDKNDSSDFHENEKILFVESLKFTFGSNFETRNHVKSPDKVNGNSQDKSSEKYGSNDYSNNFRSNEIDLPNPIDRTENTDGRDNFEENINYLTNEIIPHHSFEYLNCDSQNEDEEIDELLMNEKMIESIFGKSCKSENLYFVKFYKQSYFHCCWMEYQDIIKSEDGKKAMYIFKSSTNKNNIRLSNNIPYLTTHKNNIDIHWWEVDKIIGERIEGNVLLVKWKNLGYDKCTFEKSEDFQNHPKYQDYLNRKNHSNPCLIPLSWIHPIQFTEENESLVSKHGQSLNENQKKYFHWLLNNWYTQRNCVICDWPQYLKMLIVASIFVYIQMKFEIFGPFLIICENSFHEQWKNIFEEWTSFNIVIFECENKESKKILMKNEIYPKNSKKKINYDRIKPDIVILSPTSFCKHHEFFLNIEWRYVLIDEIYELCDEESKIRNYLLKMEIEHLTLSLSDSFIQSNDRNHNFHIFNLLNPIEFSSKKDFIHVENDALFNHLNIFNQSEDFMKIYRNQVKNVFLEMTTRQITLYKNVIFQNRHFLTTELINSEKLINIMSDIENILIHPSIIDRNEDDFISSCSKLSFLDKLIQSNLEKKIVIFTKNAKTFPILDHYFNMKNLLYLAMHPLLTFNEKEENLTNEEILYFVVYLTNDFEMNEFMKMDIFVFYENIDDCNFPFLNQTSPIIYRLVTNRSIELIPNYFEYYRTSSENIEFLLRGTIESLFQEIGIDFSLLSIKDILQYEPISYHQIYQSQISQNKHNFWEMFFQKNFHPSEILFDPLSFIDKIIENIIDHGFLDRDNLEKGSLVKFLFIYFPPIDSTTKHMIESVVEEHSKIFHVNSKNEIRSIFMSTSYHFQPLITQIYQSIVYFELLRKALFVLSSPQTNWPFLDPNDDDPIYNCSIDYAFLYNVYRFGFNQIQNNFEGIKAKMFSLITIINNMNPSNFDVPFDFSPLHPNLWNESHTSRKDFRKEMFKEDFVNVFYALMKFGLPINNDQTLNYHYISQIAEAQEIVINSISKCVEDIILFVINFRSNHLLSSLDLNNYEIYTQIGEMVKIEEFKSLFTTIRIMSNVYSMLKFFSNNKKILSNENYDFLQNVAGNGIESDEQLSYIEAKLMEMKKKFMKKIKISSTLMILNYGKILKNLQTFTTKKYYYPIGFTSKRYFSAAKSIGIPDSWYLCSIELFGNIPLFIISGCNDPNDTFPNSDEFIGLTPTEAWKSLLIHYTKEGMAKEAMSKLKISGEWFFGLTHPCVIKHLQE